SDGHHAAHQGKRISRLNRITEAGLDEAAQALCPADCDYTPRCSDWLGSSHGARLEVDPRDHIRARAPTPCERTVSASGTAGSCASDWLPQLHKLWWTTDYAFVSTRVSGSLAVKDQNTCFRSRR